ncbi:MAG: histidinol dehydrogenase [Actinobacteria bacterium]|nr:MAG: histidinol dehydrogenase [Actinomycetota bacterium]
MEIERFGVSTPDDIERVLAMRPKGGIDAGVLDSAADIIAEVRAHGDQAIYMYTQRFDGVRLDALRVMPEELATAASKCDAGFLEALAVAADRITSFHERQRQNSWFVTSADGSMLGQKVTPVARAGIYVPGGRAAYPSSVLMNAIPAKVAGVPEIAMAVPPGPDGQVKPEVLAAAELVGVTEVYKMGGAQAIAAFAYGTGTIRRVDKITGPGNAYVTAAKKLVVGDVGIDMLAGPSEVVVVADETADGRLVAADMLAQAEHDPNAAAICLTTSLRVAEEVERQLERLLEANPRCETCRASLRDNGMILTCRDMDIAIELANEIAPEHLEILTAKPEELLGKIRNAGAIFLGPNTPEAVGDYLAGPNHVLPTGGTARFYSPLSVDDFVKKSSVLSYSAEGLRRDGMAVWTIAEAEGLDAHARSVGERLERSTEASSGGHSQTGGGRGSGGARGPGESPESSEERVEGRGGSAEGSGA